MRKYILFVFVVSTFFACQNDESATNNNPDAKVTDAVPGQPGSGDAVAPQPTAPALPEALPPQNPLREEQEVWEEEGKPTTWAAAGFDDPLKFKAGFEKFRTDLVANDKKEEIAGLIRFPIKRVKTKEEFLNQYNMIFNEGTKAYIMASNVNQIYRNQLGAMIAGGKIWFTPANNEYGFQIVTIN
ncbi:MAG: hypothetical protein R2879_09830 [Saprospiraceae bacterium]